MQEDLRATVGAAARGDRAAFDSLFARNLPALMAYLRVKAGEALTARESVSDLAQSVCREVLQDLGEYEYRGDEAFRAWLFLQATRKIRDRARFLRRRCRDERREELRAMGDEESESLVLCYSGFCTPSRQASAREELARIEGALEELPEPQREAVTLSRVMNLEYPAIAELLGISESAVRGLVARGLARLSSLLHRDT